MADINRSFARTVPQLDKVGEKNINLVIAAIGYSLHLDQYRNKLQPAERAELILEHCDFAV